MKYFDKNGMEIKSGMYIKVEGFSLLELVYNTIDIYGKLDLGINASNEAYLKHHPSTSREFYSLSNFNMKNVEIINYLK